MPNMKCYACEAYLAQVALVLGTDKLDPTLKELMDHQLHEGCIRMRIQDGWSASQSR